MQARHEPAALILSRQAMPSLDRDIFAPVESLHKGTYVLADTPSGNSPDSEPDVILIGTGSEVCLCIEAYERLVAENIRARVVSMPSWEIFEYTCQKDPQYCQSVLPESVMARVSVEQASTFGWSRYVGDRGTAIGMTTFGTSAPLKELQKKYGFTPDAVYEAAKVQLAQS